MEGYPDTKDIEIPEQLVEKWKLLVNLMAKILDVPAGLIMRVHPPYIEVFQSSETEENPYEPGEREKLTSLYCEEVITSRERLHVPHAQKNERWRDNPDVELGMISYLGFPIEWPDGNMFGTICVLDSEERHYGENSEQLMKQFKELIEAHLRLLWQKRKIQNGKERYQSKKRQYDAVFNHPGVFVCLLDLDGKVLEANEAALDLINALLQEVKGKKFWNTPWWSHSSKLQAKVRKSIQQAKEGETVSFEGSLYSSNDRRVVVDYYLRPVKTEKGKIVQLLAVGRNITKLKETEAELRQSYRIINSSPAVVFLWKNAEGWPVEFVSKNVKELFGYTQEAFTSGKVPYEKTVHEDDLERVANEVAQYSKEKGRKQFVHEPYRIVTKDGKVKWVDDRTYIRRNEEGGITHYQGIVLDITKRKKLEEKLEYLHKWAQLLNQVDNMDDIFKHTLDAMEQTLGFKYAAVQLIEENKLKIKATRGFEQLPEEIKLLPLDGKGVTVKVANTGKSIRHNDVTSSQEYLSVAPNMKSELAVPIRRNDTIIGVLNVEHEEVNAFDQKDQQLLETLASHVAVAIKELQEKKKRVSLQRLEELRNQFLTMAAHEIKTPLTPIKSKLEMLQRGYQGTLKNDQKRKIESILNSVDRLSRLVDDFRKITNLRTEYITLEKDEERLAATIEEATAKYEDIFEVENITVIKDIPTSIAAVYDKDRIIQMFRNLVENAIDYTKDKIWIKAWENEEQVTVSIRDNGPGIPEEKQEDVFKPFNRVEEDRSRNARSFGGSGLGLHICKQIVEAHGGSIQVDTKQEEGCTFTVRLPKEGKSNEETQKGTRGRST